MTDDAKEWVTIKVPKTVRDDARDDPRTYGEIMRAGTEGAPDFDLEQEALFERLSGVEDVLGQNNIQREEFRVQLEEISEQLDEIANTASMASDPGADGVEIAQRIINRIDDLETELTRQHEGLGR